MRTTISLLLFMAFAATIEAKPNFIVVIGDDAGWDAFGCTGMKEARTPAIDQLARESCMMQRFYCSVSQCAPLRAELYTGLLPNRNGVLANATRVKRPGVKNVADHLRPLGYRVGLTGKRHFALGKGKIDTIPGFPANANGSNQTHSLDGVRNYISKSKEAGESFCVFIGSTHAHHPWDHGEESRFPVEGINLRPHYVDTPAARQAMAKHAAEVEVLDQQVRETREMMKTMNLEKNTILIFLSEQGIAMPRGKWSPYEHGSRALCLAYWPQHIPARKTGALSMYCDIVPTLLDFAGGAATDLDGRSLKTVWTTEKTDTHREAVFISNVHPFWQKAIVTDTYKLIWTGHPERDHIWGNFRSKSKFFSKPWTEWTAEAARDEDAAQKVSRILSPSEFELYDVISDPYEVSNLATFPEQRDRMRSMHEELKTLMLNSGESLTPELPQKGKRKIQN
jgi:N-sulfoglucosamine sulfohydrolase